MENKNDLLIELAPLKLKQQVEGEVIDVFVDPCITDCVGVVENSGHTQKAFENEDRPEVK